MKIPCELIMDLIPLFQENLCSEETKKILEEHVKDCPKCQLLLVSQNESIFDLPPKKGKIDDKKSMTIIRGINRKLKLKKILIGVLSFLCAIFLTVGIYLFFTEYKLPVNYHENLVTIEEQADGSVTIRKNSNFYYLNALTGFQTINGKEEKVAYIFYTDNIISRFFKRAEPENVTVVDFIGTNVKFNYSGKFIYFNGNGMISDSQNESDEVYAIYYLDGGYTSFRNFGEEFFNEVPQNAILLWQRQP